MSITLTEAFQPDVHGVVHRLGALRTGRGAVAACDPLSTSLERRRPFAANLPPGEHPVDVLLVGNPARAEVALARVAVPGRVAVAFELAIFIGQDVRTLAPGQLFTYGVDSGTGCFFDPDAAGLLSSPSQAEAWLSQLKAHRRPDWSYALALVPGDTGAAAVLFTSGGDGAYATWLGRDASGEPACLITDFGLLDLELPEVPDDPGFRRAYVDAQVELLYSLVPKLGGPEGAAAWEAEAEIAGLASEATGHLAKFVHRLRAIRNSPTPDRPAALLFIRLVKDVLRDAEAQSALVPELPALDDELLAQILPARPRAASPLLARALRERLAHASSELRAGILPIHYAAAPRDGIALAAELIRAEDAGSAFDQALNYLRRIRSPADVPEPQALRQRIVELEARATDDVRRATLARIRERLDGPRAGGGT